MVETTYITYDIIDIILIPFSLFMIYISIRYSEGLKEKIAGSIVALMMLIYALKNLNIL